MCVCVCDAVTEFERVLRWILSEGASVNLYMFHGGTNFGFLAGANDRLNPTNESYIIDYSPVVTSYGSSLIALCVISHLMTNFTVWRMGDDTLMRMLLMVHTCLPLLLTHCLICNVTCWTLSCYTVLLHMLQTMTRQWLRMVI